MHILQGLSLLVVVAGVYAKGVDKQFDLEDSTDSTDDPRCPVNCAYQPVGCECSVFYQCREGIYSEYRCPNGLHFNQGTGQCDTPEHAGCNLNPKTCCECKHIGEPCKPEYIFQDYDRTVDYTGDHHCIRENRRCDHGLLWNPNANKADGACDFSHNIPNCRNFTIQV